MSHSQSSQMVWTPMSSRSGCEYEEQWLYDNPDKIPEQALHPPYCLNKVKQRVETVRLLHKQFRMLDKHRKTTTGIPEAGFQELYEYLYRKRFEIVSGVEVDTFCKEASEETPGNDVTEEVKGIPNFWFGALYYGVGEHVVNANKFNKMALGFLQDIKVHNMNNPMRVRLEFVFECNPFFKNSVLTKTYHLRADDKKLFATKAIGTDIDWYPGKCLTKEIQRARPDRHSRSTKPVITYDSCESFFHYFKTRERHMNCPFEYDAGIYKHEDNGGKYGDAPEDNVNIEDDKNSGSSFHENDNSDGFDTEDDDDDDAGWDSAEDSMTGLEDCNAGSMLLREVIPKAVKWYSGQVTHSDIAADSSEDDFDEEDIVSSNDESEVNCREDCDSSNDDSNERNDVDGSDEYDASILHGLQNDLNCGSFDVQSEVNCKEDCDSSDDDFNESNDVDGAIEYDTSILHGLQNDLNCGTFDLQSEVMHDGGKNLSVRQTSSVSEGLQTLLKGDAVESAIKNVDGNYRAVDALRMNGSSISSGNGLGDNSNSGPSKREKGVVKCFNGLFGFIVPNDSGKDLFVHRASVRFEGFHTLLVGEHVEYGIENVNGRFEAVDVLRLNGSCGNGSLGTKNGESGKMRGDKMVADRNTQAGKREMGEGTSSGGMAKPKLGLMKPALTKVDQLRPGTSRHTLTVKVASVKMVWQKGRSVGSKRRQWLTAECLVGDETGTIVFTASSDQVDLMKPKATVILRNAKIDMPNGSMRLAVDQLGHVEVSEPANFTLREDNNVSLVVYSQVNINFLDQVKNKRREDSRFGFM